ncbi:MAG: lysophospholipid acyltransferase family protein [Cyclobacteriaceae bacterium]|nr:lysophospholipid acyltransferase family protein [Cyclobacteriaceae bacterium]
MLRPLYKLIFKLSGWKMEGSFSPEVKKYIIAVAPHTSNWDFVIGVMARSILRLQRARFLGKDSLFKPPFGWLFRWLGGYPVDRTKNNDMVQQVVDIFNRHDQFILAMAPEGTRKKVSKLRTGFYFIAKNAGVPIIPVGFDFSKKCVVIGEPLYASDNLEADFNRLLSFYRNIRGKNPESGID